MGSKTLIAAAVFFFGIAASAQMIQLDPSELNSNSNSAQDAKLVAVQPIPASEQQDFQQAVKDIHFDFDKADLRPEDRPILEADAEWLKAHPDVMITLEGDADERGDIVYNVVLSGERANTVKDALVEMGVSPDRIAYATGWGKLYPLCLQGDEDCWSRNRRTHLDTWPPAGQEERHFASRY